jgi:hypothetical protein
MLSRVVPLRRRMHEEWLAGGRAGPPVWPLKLVIMSATLRTEDFTGNKRWGGGVGGVGAQAAAAAAGRGGPRGIPKLALGAGGAQLGPPSGPFASRAVPS